MTLWGDDKSRPIDPRLPWVGEYRAERSITQPSPKFTTGADVIRPWDDVYQLRDIGQRCLRHCDIRIAGSRKIPQIEILLDVRS